MPNKCSVVGCKSGYKDGPDYPRFQFPRDQELKAKWLLFLNRPADYEVTDISFICSRHFETTYLKVTAKNLTRLNYTLDPIPTIHPESIPKSQASVPTKSRPPPKERICQQDEISIFEEKFRIRQFLDVVEFLKQAPEYVDFKLHIEENFVTAYNLAICSGVASVKECITIYIDFRVQLSYEGSPIPLPNYIQESTGHKLIHLDALENLPNYCRNFHSKFDVDVIKELLKLCYFSPCGRPKYSSQVLRFSLILRYTSNSAYSFLKKYIPLPSNSLLRKLKSPSIGNCQALQALRDSNCIGNDIVILLDEMHLQSQVQFDGHTLIGCNADMDMYTSILCFMVVSLRKSIPFVISAIPLIKNSGEIVYQNIEKCLSLLTQSQFRVRAIISDNHSTNVKAYNILLTNYKFQDKNYKITSPCLSHQNIYLLFDTCHLIKNIRNNLLSKKFFDIPAFEFTSVNINISFPAGFVQWSHLHTIHERDLHLSSHLPAAYKINSSVLHPGTNKQSVALVLALFHETTIAAIRLYLPEEEVIAGFFNLIRVWWLCVNSKERFHPLTPGNALVRNDCKAEFLCSFSSWLNTWQDSKKFGLSQQTFKALIQSNYAISELSLELLNEGYEYVLTGRLQSDPLERRFSQYRQLSRGRFLVSLQEVLRSESIIKLKSLLKRNIDISSLCSPNIPTSLIKDYAQDLLLNDCDHLRLTEDSQQVIVYISGYISLSLAERLKCPDCSSSLQNNKVSSEYFNNLNQGGLTLPNTSLHHYVSSAFCMLEVSERHIRESGFPWKTLAQELLNFATDEWDTSFACTEHSMKSRELVNNIISNIYFNNLRKQISETRRKDQVSAFKSNKRQKI